MPTSDRRAWLLQTLEQTHTAGQQQSPAGMEKHDHEAWEADVDLWAKTDCVFRDRRFTGIGHLHLAFSEWAVKNQGVPCRRDVFEALLLDQCFETADGLVYGLTLKSDLKQEEYLDK